MEIDMGEVRAVRKATPIKVIGVGHGGCNAVDHMCSHGVQGMEFIFADTDVRELSRHLTGRTLQLGASGLGAAQLMKGRVLAEHSEEQIHEAIGGAKVLFVVAALGSGTGSGSAPVIARLAKELDILTVGVVTLPALGWETIKRMEVADAGLVEIERYVDLLIVLSLDALFDQLGTDDVTEEEFFGHANELLRNVVDAFAEFISVAASI